MKYKLIKQKIIALALTGTMIFSLAGCESSYRVKEEDNDSKIISSTDENGNDLSVIILYDQHRDNVIKEELYGYLDKETLDFYDVINKKEYNFNDKEFHRFGGIYLTVEEFLSSINSIKNSKKSDKAVLDYAINKGISEEDLAEIEKSYYVIKETQYQDKIYLKEDYYKIEINYTDDLANAKEEETSLAKKMN